MRIGRLFSIYRNKELMRKVLAIIFLFDIIYAVAVLSVFMYQKNFSLMEAFFAFTSSSHFINIMVIGILSYTFSRMLQGKWKPKSVPKGKQVFTAKSPFTDNKTPRQKKVEVPQSKVHSGIWTCPNCHKPVIGNQCGYCGYQRREQNENV